jgi:hypothetical protein
MTPSPHNAGELMQRLEALGRVSAPAKALGLGPGKVGATEGPSFASLLDELQQSAVAGPREVSVAGHAGLSLSRDQLARIGRAIDAAEAQGASTALVLIDDRALRVDVTLREVTGEVDLHDGSAATGLDAVVSAGAPASAGAPSIASFPLLNPSLTRLLARLGPNDPASAQEI